MGSRVDRWRARRQADRFLETWEGQTPPQPAEVETQTSRFEDDDRWAEHWTRIRAQLRAKAYGEVAQWLNGQSIAVIETQFLRRMSQRTIAKLHRAAVKHPGVGPASRFAEITRYRFLVYRVRWAIRNRRWPHAAKWLNGFSASDIRARLARLPFATVGQLRTAAIAHPKVGPSSNLARITQRSTPYPAFFPPRALNAPGGSSVLAGWADRGAPRRWVEREQALIEQLLAGNIPSWLRTWVPVPVTFATDSGSVRVGRVFVLPDYLAIGDDTDFVHVPLDKHSAQHVARQLGAVLPTARICHAIYLESRRKGQHLPAQPRDYYRTAGRRTAPPGWAQTSSAAYREHSAAIQSTLRAQGIPPGSLVAGHKKDVVIAARLHQHPTKVAFHGFYDAQGVPFEPCYERPAAQRGSCRRDTPALAHPQPDGRFSDYSQGVRLVHRWMEFEGRPTRVSRVLAHPKRSLLISSEGPIQPPRIPKG